MDVFVVALIAGLAFWAGSAYGFARGMWAAEEAQVRRRIAELPKPWERTK